MTGPYIVITKRRACDPWPWESVVSRLAVATLEEACPECHGHGQPQGDGSGWDGTTMHTPACSLCGGDGFDLPESGGTVGPLPDGTVIEVAHDPMGDTMRAACPEISDMAWRYMKMRERIDAYNARQKATV